jgi:hypothetical protein
MAVNSVLAPYPTFFDATGAPLENGSIYIGEAGFEARSTPKASFFDDGLTIPTGTASGAAIRTSGGFPVNQSGSPAMFYVDGEYSISVCDRNGVLLYSSLTPTLVLNAGGAVGPVLWADGNLSAVGGGFAGETNTGFVRPSANTMQTVVSGVLVSTQTDGGTDFAQPVSGTGFNSGVLAVAQPLDADLTALAGLTGTGIAVRTAGNTWAQRQVTSSDGSIAVTNPAGVAGDINLSAGGLFFRLNSAFAGTNGTAAQGIFPLSVTLEASTVYDFDIVFSLTKTTGTTNHFVSIGFGGTATLNNLFWYHDASAFSPGTVASSLTSAGYYTSAAAQNLTGNVGTAATMNVWVRIKGTVSINGGGTFIPQYTLSAAPGGAYSTNIGALFNLRKLGASGADNSQGPWA